MGEIDNLIDGFEESEESPDVRQELLNSIHTGFMQFPLIDLEVDSSGIALVKGFSHSFKPGITTPGFTDKIAGKFKPSDNTLSIFMPKEFMPAGLRFKKEPTKK
jgi:hypothetical protein